MKRFMKHLVNSLLWATALFVGSILIGAAIFSFAEGVSFGDSVWWAIITTSTVGYGDISPVTIPGRIVGSILAFLVSLLIGPILVYHILAGYAKDRDKLHHEEQEEIMGRLRDFDEGMEYLAFLVGGADAAKHMAKILDTQNAVVVED